MPLRRTRIAWRAGPGVLLAACFLISSHSRGENVLAIESFSQTGSSLDGANDGSGWGAPWTVQNDSTNVPGYNIVNATPLTYPGLSSSGGYAVGGDSWQNAGRLLDTSSEGAFAPYLNEQLIGLPGSTILFGVLMPRISTQTMKCLSPCTQGPRHGGSALLGSLLVILGALLTPATYATGRYDWMASSIKPPSPWWLVNRHFWLCKSTLALPALCVYT